MTRQRLLNLAVAVAVTGLPAPSSALAQDRTSNGNTTGSAGSRALWPHSALVATVARTVGP